MASHVLLIEICAVRETRQRLAPFARAYHHRIEVYHATVLELVCDEDGEPTDVVCGCVVPTPALQGENTVAASADSSRPKEAAA
jgi:hypothetical protein